MNEARYFEQFRGDDPVSRYISVSEAFRRQLENRDKLLAEVDESLWAEAAFQAYLDLPEDDPDE